MLPRPALLLSLAGLASRTVAQNCYYPDGGLATDYTYQPCVGGGGVSSCCIPSEGDKCLSNGLCYWPSGAYPFRGACTGKCIRVASFPADSRRSNLEKRELHVLL